MPLSNSSQDTCYCSSKGSQSEWKFAWKFHKKLEKDQYDPTLQLLGMYPVECTSYYRGTCSLVLAPSTTAREWKQTRCSSSNEWKMKMLSICITKYAVKRNDDIAGKWMELEVIIPSGPRKTVAHVLSHLQMLALSLQICVFKSQSPQKSENK